MSLRRLSDEKLILERVFHQLLPQNVSLLVTPEKRAIALFWESDSPQNSIESFTRAEWEVLLALAESYPYYSPHEALLAHLTSTSVEHARQLIQEAQTRRTLQQAVRPIRDVIKKLRAKLRPFSLTVSALYGLGYFLAVVSSTPK